MAIDHALFESVQDGAAPTLRFYRWDPPCLSLGRNQPARVALSDLRGRGLDLVRRPTGGLAVLHDRELTYSVCVRADQFGSPRVAYAAINRALLFGLVQLGVPAEAASENTTAATFRRAGSCFAGTAPGEVGVRGRKLIGSAQRCERRTILQHGSILLGGDQTLADELLGRKADPEPATTVAEVLGSAPGWAELQSSLAAAFETEIGIALAPAALDASEQTRANELTALYLDAEWTWRV
ncbi:MAG: lipoate--protein ligase family protein [Gemmatimonadota bacterium]